MWVRLDEIFEINPKNTNSDSDICGFVPMANVDDGFSGTHSYKERKWGEVKKGYCHFQNGDIAVAKISPCFENLKSTIFHSLPNNIGAGTTELVILRGHLVYGPYFLYLFKSQWYIGKGIVYFKGVVGQQRVNRDIFTSLEVPLPPLNEQRRIVSVIQRLFAVIDIVENNSCELKYNIEATKQKVLELAITGKLVPQDPTDEPAADLLQRVNPNAVVSADTSHYNGQNLPNGWIQCKFSDLFNVRSARRVHKADWRSEGIPFYRAREIGKLSDLGTVDNDLYIDSLLYSEFAKSGVPQSGDIMITAVGTLGKTYIVRKGDKFYYKDGSVLCIENRNGIDPRYIEMFISTSHFKEQYIWESQGTTVATLTMDRINSYSFVLPPLNEQKRIVSKVDELFAVIDQIKQSLE